MQVTVTADDIAMGSRMSPWRCPVALALRRASPGSKRVSVSSILLVYYRRFGTSERAYKIPAEVDRFVKMFDGGYRVEPFTFELGEPIEHWTPHDRL